LSSTGHVGRSCDEVEYFRSVGALETVLPTPVGTERGSFARGCWAEGWDEEEFLREASLAGLAINGGISLDVDCWTTCPLKGKKNHA
jgi:hypothetical protein